MKRLSLAFVALLGSCGLISSDIDDFALGFPQHDFTVDSASWNLNGTSTVPTVACGTIDCATVATSFCSAGCTADCDGSNCEGHVPVSYYDTVNLALERSEFSQIDEYTEVVIDDIDFVITENTFNITTPNIHIYLGPITALSPTDSGAQEIGVLSPIPPGETGTYSLSRDPAGVLTTETFLKNYTTPFNIIVGTTVDLPAGTALPTGRLVGYVDIKAHAQF